MSIHIPIYNNLLSSPSNTNKTTLIHAATISVAERAVDRPSYATSPPQGMAPIHTQAPTAPPLPQLPTEPPFKAYIGNVPFDIDEEVMAHFFRDLSVCDIIIPRYKDSGRAKSCFVEFTSQDDLKRALARNGAELFRKSLKIQLAERPKNGVGGGSGSFHSRGDGPTRSTSRGGYRGGDGGGYRGGDGGDFSRPTQSNPRINPGDRWTAIRDVPDVKQQPMSPAAGERPKLLLKPRSQPATGETDSAAGDGAGAKSNPFGNAKPTDTAAKLLELEERDKAKKDVATQAPQPPSFAAAAAAGIGGMAVVPTPPHGLKEQERRGGGGVYSRGRGDRRGGGGDRRAGDRRGGGGGKGRGDGSSKLDGRAGKSGGSNSNAPKMIRAPTSDDAPKTKIANPYDLLADA